MPYIRDDDSIASFDDDEEIETNDETKITNEPVETAKIEISAKTGKPKRIMTEKQKLAFAKARAKGREVRKANKELREKEKQIKKEDLLIRKLECEKKVMAHESRKKQLLVDTGYISEESAGLKKKKERAEYGSKKVKEEENEEDEIEALERKLANLKKTKKPKAPKTPDVSENEDSEEEIVLPERKKNPKIKLVMEPDRVKPKNPIRENKKNIDPLIQMQMLSMFPNFKPK